MEFDRDRKLEFSRPEEIRKVQEGLLHKHLRYLASHSPYYRALFTAQRIDAANITVDTLHTLPLTDKTALSLANDDFLAVPLSRDRGHRPVIGDHRQADEDDVYRERSPGGWLTMRKFPLRAAD